MPFSGPGQNGVGGSVWVFWDMNGQVLSGASVTGLGTMGMFLGMAIGKLF